MSFFNRSANHKKGNIEWYIDNQKSSLGADFLLLENEEQKKILKTFNVDDVNKLLSDDVTVAQLWTLELLILNHLSFHQLVRRVWIIREKFRLQCGDEVYKRYTDSLDENLKKITLDDKILESLRADVVNIARQLQRIGYNNILRSDSINERKKVVITLALIIVAIIFCMFF